MVKLKCDFCGKDFERIKWLHTQHTRKKLNKNFCSAKCKNKFQSETHGCNWKGGKQKNGRYIAIWLSKGKRIFEHRLVMEKKIGRKVRKGEVIHHINGNPIDNRIENLVLCKTHGQHTAKFHPQKKKTHCKRGHKLVKSNIYFGKKGERNCKICNKISAIKNKKAKDYG